MAEQPVRFGKKKALKTKISAESSKRLCIIHFPEHKAEKAIGVLTDISFKKIHESLELRQACEDSNKRMDHICSQIPYQLNKDIHGIHRKCYQEFTNIRQKKSRKRQH